MLDGVRGGVGVGDGEGVGVGVGVGVLDGVRGGVGVGDGEGVGVGVGVGDGDGICCLGLDRTNAEATKANANIANKMTIKINNFRLSIAMKME